MTLPETIGLVIKGLTFGSWGILVWMLLKPTKNILRAYLLAFIFFINGIFLWFLIYPPELYFSKETSSTTAGEMWDIETVFKTEKNFYYRDWKRRLLKELQGKMNAFRSQKGFLPVPIEIIESYSPKKLQALLSKSPENLVLIDVREAMEIKAFFLSGSRFYRYGDFVNNIFPDLPKNKKIVIVCYSGIRGFLIANLLQLKGYKNIAFIRGGLGAWVEAGLPIEGRDEFDFIDDRYPLLTEAEVKNSSYAKIYIETVAPPEKRLLPAYSYEGDLVSTNDQDRFIQRFISEPIILICDTESSCFSAVAFGYLFEKSGGKIEGYLKKDS